MPVFIDYIHDADDYRVLCPFCGAEDECEHSCNVCETFDHGTADHDDDDANGPWSIMGGGWLA